MISAQELVHRAARTAFNSTTVVAVRITTSSAIIEFTITRPSEFKPHMVLGLLFTTTWSMAMVLVAMYLVGLRRISRKRLWESTTTPFTPTRIAASVSEREPATQSSRITLFI